MISGESGVVPLALGGAGLLASGDPLALPLPQYSRVQSPARPSADGDGGGSLGAGEVSPWSGPDEKAGATDPQYGVRRKGRWCRGRDRRLVLDWAVGRGVREGDVAAAVKQGWVSVLMCHMCVL